MKRICLIAMLVLAVACLTSCRSKKTVVVQTPRPNVEEYAVLGFLHSTNVPAGEAKDITDVFRVNFRPSKYKAMDYDRVDRELEKRGYKNKTLTKQQVCEVGRNLGVKYVVVGTINKLMDEYSVDVQVVNVLKETTVAFEGNAFQKKDCSKEMQTIAQRLASKVE